MSEGISAVDSLKVSKLVKNKFFILLLNLSYNHLKQAQINTVVVQQEEMDRVGVEPTTSAMLLN
jgi:hypothetical protein